MSDEEARRLLHSRHFCTDRLVEVKEDLARIQAEDLELKSKLDGAGEAEAGQIRRRRRHLSRRLNEMKAERAALAAELQESTDKLKMIHQV
ncbi:hypothetical protein [Reyranella sp.]|uniref:hypothetical protein n=1 Tax=Reyranella sp. TaxID=1929291 RepID=UPI0027213ED0|nr:hypothetical protein [Reyranella sp.]MDO8976807.1 hypothetical protein [Reyranella sp.]MDP3240228.1 hypothetical protein [Reyranella sp.]